MNYEAVSRLSPPVIGPCMSCDAAITPYDVMASTGIDGRLPVRVAWQCGECDATGMYEVPADRFLKLNNKWEDYLGKAKYSYDTEYVGRRVAAFRNALDTIATVDDIDWGTDV